MINVHWLQSKTQSSCECSRVHTLNRVFSKLQPRQPLVFYMPTSPWCMSVSLHIPAGFTSLSCCTFLCLRATFLNLCWCGVALKWEFEGFNTLSKKIVLHLNTIMHYSARLSTALLGKAGNRGGQYSSRVVPGDCCVSGAVWLLSAQDFHCCL